MTEYYSKTHEKACKYARNGYRIIPLSPDRKTPYLKGWPDLATSDIRQINDWFRMCPEANIGLPMAKNYLSVGADLNPMFEIDEDTDFFHNVFKQACDKHDPTYYPKFKQWEDEYFMIKHWGEIRGVGGIFLRI